MISQSEVSHSFLSLVVAHVDDLTGTASDKKYNNIITTLKNDGDHVAVTMSFGKRESENHNFYDSFGKRGS